MLVAIAFRFIFGVQVLEGGESLESKELDPERGT